MSRKPTKKSLKNKLWELCKEYTRKTQKYKCQWCGKKPPLKQLHTHHIYTKGAGGNTARYDLDNMMLLCWRCHDHQSKKYYGEFKDFVDEWLKPKGLSYDMLRDRYLCVTWKPTIEDLTLKIKIVQSMIDELKEKK